jgi:hypothetical protein
MYLPMPFGGPVAVPLAAMLAPHDPPYRTVDDGLIGGQYRGVEVDLPPSREF